MAQGARAQIIEAAEANGWTADRGYSSEGAWAASKCDKHITLQFLNVILYGKEPAPIRRTGPNSTCPLPASANS